MHRLMKTLWALMLLPVLAGAQTNPQKVALIGARVIDGRGRTPIENGVVLMAAGKIQAVGKKGAVKIPGDARQVDVTGKTLMPALVDLHTHLGQTINGLDPAADGYSEENLRSHNWPICSLTGLEPSP